MLTLHYLNSCLPHKGVWKEEAQNNLGILYVLQGKFEEAIEVHHLTHI